jgi:hypothetical protein
MQTVFYKILYLSPCNVPSYQCPEIRGCAAPNGSQTCCGQHGFNSQATVRQITWKSKHNQVSIGKRCSCNRPVLQLGKPSFIPATLSPFLTPSFLKADASRATLVLSSLNDIFSSSWPSPVRDSSSHSFYLTIQELDCKSVQIVAT